MTPRADGVETLTESDKPEIAAKIQEHVAAMYRRVEEGRPIHMRDPLFAEVFRHAGQIELKFDKTEKGVKVVETSKDPYVVKLIQAHAEVVNLFVKNGFEEPPKNHAVPAAATADKPAEEPTNLVAAGPCGKCPTCCAQQATAACKTCPKAAAVDPSCKACPNAANCPAGKACPSAAGQGNAACKACPKGAADSACKACPNATNCPAGKACPSAAGQGDAACKACPKGTADSACMACPNAANCPRAASCLRANTDDDTPPPPNQGAKSKPGNAKGKGTPES